MIQLASPDLGLDGDSDTDSGDSAGKPSQFPTHYDLSPPPATRNTEAAERIRRAVGRYLVEACAADCLFEVTLPNKRRADVMALTANGELWIIEVKSCHADYLSDSKWPDYLDYCDRFWFATDALFDPALLPPEQGHLITDGYELVERQPGALVKLAAARRKALLQRFASLAARRLYLLSLT